jgi:purine-binding chemotaxis protein CheW
MNSTVDRLGAEFEGRSVEPAEILEERAKLLAQPFTGSDEAQTVEVVLFRSGSEQVAVPIAAVREAAPRCPAVPLPHTPPFVLGVINLHGEILPLLDLANLLDAKGSTQPQEIIVLRLGAGVDCAIPADSAGQCFTVRKDSIEPAERLGKEELPLWIKGLLRIDGQSATLIDPERLLDSDPRILAFHQHSTNGRDR